jgi:hypothetical protein
MVGAVVRADGDVHHADRSYATRIHRARILHATVLIGRPLARRRCASTGRGPRQQAAGSRSRVVSALVAGKPKQASTKLHKDRFLDRDTDVRDRGGVFVPGRPPDDRIWPCFVTYLIVVPRPTGSTPFTT